jgi:hypothetical protein
MEGNPCSLDRLAERFSDFERQVVADTRARKVTEEASFEVLRDTLCKLENSLNTEIQRCESSNRSAQAACEAKVSAAQNKLEALFLEQFDHVHSLVDALDDRIGTVEKTFVHARENYLQDMHDRSTALDEELSDLGRAFEDEMAERKENESKILARICRSETAVDEKLVREQRTCEQKYVQLAKDAAENNHARQECLRNYQEKIMTELEDAKHQLAMVTKARVLADDDIALALNHYTQALQGALSTVSKGTVQAASSI